MRAGMGRAGLRPAEFWGLTPLELMLLLGLDPADAPLARPGLADLMARFPDLPPPDRNREAAPPAAGPAAARPAMFRTSRKDRPYE